MRVFSIEPKLLGKTCAKVTATLIVALSATTVQAEQCDMTCYNSAIKTCSDQYKDGTKTWYAQGGAFYNCLSEAALRSCDATIRGYYDENAAWSMQVTFRPSGAAVNCGTFVNIDD